MIRNDEKYGESKCNYLLIRFRVIYFLCLLDSYDLDCFGLFAKALAMTKCGDSRIVCGICDSLLNDEMFLF